MRLFELLIDDWIAIPLEAEDLEEALRRLLTLLRTSGVALQEKTGKLATEIAGGARGDVRRVNREIVVVAARVEGLEDVSVTLGVSRSPFAVTTEDLREGTARVVLLLLTPRRLSSLEEQFIPALTRALARDEMTEQLLDAGSPTEVRAIRELMETELHERLLVEDALSPLTYRIYPDTPLTEIVDLMVRRRLHAVPVVGENLEVLGIISVGDALEHLLPHKRGGDGDPPGGEGGAAVPMARDVMTRTVMCVSEDQSLLDAAHLMVNRDVDQLPVVREGELIGFLTRSAILERLFGSSGPVQGSGS